MGWYERRSFVEDYHQCLKSGCRLEERQVQTVARLIRLVGDFSPPAVRLLHLRDLARREPMRPECLVLEAECSAVAQMGGYLARHGDGPPGRKTLWKGWLRVQTLLEGFHLAAHLRL